MRKIFSLFILIICLGIVSQAQITSAEMPAIGDTVWYKVINTNTFNELPGTTGVGVTWDYSTVYEKPDTVVLWYIDPATTTQADSFPGATVAEATVGTDGNFYYSLSGSDFYRDGFFDNSIIEMYSNKLKLASLPIQFGTNFTDAYLGTGWMTGVTSPAFIDDGSYTFDCQGVGTLRLPIGYFDSVFRVYYEEEFSVQSDFLGMGTPTTIFSVVEYGYEYWKPGVVKPILTFYQTTIDDMMGGHSVTKAARYQKKLTPDGMNPGIIENPQMQILVSPNPTSGIVNVSLDGNVGICDVYIYNTLGQIISSTEQNQSSFTIDLTSAEKGVYIIKVVNENGSLITDRLIVR